jgi:exonuclease III
LGDKLATSDYDLLCLQEVWVQEDFLYIQAKVRHFLPYSHYYYAGFLGSGLAIFSRWPILSTSMFQFQMNGRPAAVWRGEYYAGKGIATALIQHHTGALIEVFNTHVFPSKTFLISFMLHMEKVRTLICVIEYLKDGKLRSYSEVLLSVVGLSLAYGFLVS